MTTNSATMIDLPDEILILIFEYLKIKDLIQCSLACQRFKSLCQDVKVPELIISNTTENIKDFWFYTNKQFNHQDSITTTTFISHRSIFRLDKFKRLYFVGTQKEYSQLKVNYFTQLEQMKIYVSDTVSVKIRINLSNVKIIEIDTASRHSCKFFMETPQLETLKCSDFDCIYLQYPTTVMHLETGFYSERFRVLQNLRFLLITYIGEFNWSKTLSALPKLETLSCTGGMFPTAIESVVTYKRNHKVSKPKMFFLSVELDDIGKIDEYDSHRDDFSFQMDNYSSLAETVFITSMDDGVVYDQVLDSMKGKIPNDFYERYFSTRRIRIENTVENQEHLFGFLKRFEYLTELKLRCDSLDQSYLNRLDELDQLTSVEINSVSPSLSTKSIFDFNFVLRLKNLKNFRTSLDSSKFFDLTLELFRHLKYFRTITFCFEKKVVNIRKDMALNRYRFSYYRYMSDRIDFDKLVREVNAARGRRIY